MEAKFIDLVHSIKTRNVKFDDNKMITDSCKELILKLLEKNPDKRISSEDLLKHPWFDEIKNQTSFFIKPYLNYNALDIIAAYNKNNKLYKAIKMFSSRFNSSSQNIMMLKNSFLKLDKSHQGKLSLDEFQECIYQFDSDKKTTPLEIQDMMSLIDLDLDGYLN